MSGDKCSLLIVDDEPFILSTLSALLGAEFEVLTAGSAEAAQAVLRQRPIDLLLTDQKMPRMTGVELMEWVCTHSPATVRIMMTGYSELEEAVEAINRGQVYRYLFKPWRTEELLQTLRTAAHTYRLERQNAQLVEELRQLNQELERRVQQRTRQLEESNAELEQKNKMLEKLALTDPLTGLPNRRAMDRLAEKELRRRERHPSPLALAMIDADHFREINRDHLHPGGDRVLIDLGKVLTGSLRSVDLLGRIGGEEFLVVAPETDLDGAQVLGERMRSTVEGTTFAYDNKPIKVTISVGVAVAEAHQPVDYDQIKHAAAAALSRAKLAGRNQCVYVSATRPPFEQAG